MKRVMQLVVFGVAAVVFTGCTGLFASLIEPDYQDVGVVAVTATEDGLDIASVSITFVNSGVSVNDVPYDLVISNGTSLMASDTVIYDATVDLPFGEQTVVTIAKSDIDAYVTANSVGYAPGSYYLGVIMDPQSVLDDADMDDNRLPSSREYDIE